MKNRGSRAAADGSSEDSVPSPLGTKEDSSVIKGELHACNTSKSSLAKWKKKRKGSGGRRQGD